MLRQISALTILAGAVLVAGSVCAQQDFVDLEKIEIEQVANAVRLRLVADGVLQVWAHPNWAYRGFQTDIWDEPAGGPSRRISFALANVRSGAPPVVEVAKYPVSHLEFSRLPWSQTGIGLVATVVLYRPGYLIAVGTGGDVEQFDEGRDYDGPRMMIETTRSQDELLITVLTDRPREPAPQRPEVSELPTELAVSGNRESLSIHAVNATVGSLLEWVAELTQTPVYVDDQVDLAVTIHLEDVPLERLLRALAVGYGLSMHREGGAYFVSLSRADTAVPFWSSEIRSVPLKYISAQEALLLLPDVLLAYARANPEANALVLNGPAPLLDRIAKDLRVVDRPAYHCRLRGWVVSGQDIGEYLRQIAASGSGGTTQWQIDSAGQLSMEVAGRRPHELVADLRGLSRRGQLQVELLPAIWVKNGQRARLFVGEKTYYWRLSGDYGPQEMSLEPVQAGCELEIEPRTSGDCVTASLKISSSFLTGGNDLGPIVLHRRMEGVVRVDSGDSVIIGGLYMKLGSEDWRRTAAVPTGGLGFKDEQEVWIIVQARASLRAAARRDNTTEVVQ